MAPHAQVTDRLSVYVPDDAKTLGVRLLGATLAGSRWPRRSRSNVPTPASTSASASPAIAPLMDEALQTYFNGFVDPLNDPHASYETARMLGSGAQDAGDVAWTLRGLMQAVHDNHGFVVGPGEAPPARRALVTRAPEFELRRDGTAIVRLHAAGRQRRRRRARLGHVAARRLAALAARHPRAWIVDLRDHDADSPWPAFAALSTLLGGPAIGASVSRQETQDWIADRGRRRAWPAAPRWWTCRRRPSRRSRARWPCCSGPARATRAKISPSRSAAGRTRASSAPPPPAFPPRAWWCTGCPTAALLGVLETRAADRKGVVQRTPIEPDDTLKDASVTLMQSVQDWLSTERERAD